MPTPAQIKATKKSIKDWIETINKKTEGNLSYNNIKEDIAQIYNIEDEIIELNNFVKIYN